MSEATNRLVQGMVDATFTGQHVIKGKSEPQKAYRLDAVRHGAARFETAISRGLSAFVGRERELEVPDRALVEASSQLQVVDLVAEPGMGKSRLLHEFRQRIGNERAFVLSGNCSPDGQQAAFLPFVEVVRGSFRIDAGEAEKDIARKHEIGLTALRRLSAGRSGWRRRRTMDAMVYLGRGAAEGRTKKRRPPAKIATRLRPHLGRWRALDAKRSAELRKAGLIGDDEQIHFMVHRMHDGQPLAGKIRSAWEGILEDAGLEHDVVRHTLRHTAATWLMQKGTDLWEAAGWLGMTVEQLEENYGHHHRDFQNEAAQAFGGRR